MSNGNSEETHDEIEGTVEGGVPIEWYDGGGIITRYVTNMVVQGSRDEFILGFYEIKRPIILGTPEEQLEQLKTLSAVRANCVARIVVTPRKLKEFLELLNDNYQQYLSGLDAEENADAGTELSN